MQRASIHEQYDIGTGERLGKARKAERTGTSGSVSRTGDYGTGGTGGSASCTGDYGTSGTGETCGKRGTFFRATQRLRLHVAGYVGAFVGWVGFCAKKLC